MHRGHRCIYMVLLGLRKSLLLSADFTYSEFGWFINIDIGGDLIAKPRCLYYRPDLFFEISKLLKIKYIRSCITQCKTNG